MSPLGGRHLGAYVESTATQAMRWPTTTTSILSQSSSRLPSTLHQLVQVGHTLKPQVTRDPSGLLPLAFATLLPLHLLADAPFQMPATSIPFRPSSPSSTPFQS